MPERSRKHLFFITALTGFILFSLSSACFAGILDSWKNTRAYKPRPVLFLHGFAKGNPGDWNPAKTALAKYFSKYRPIGTYLETINFQDPNGSIDTYGLGKTNPQGNNKGWSDKVKDKVNLLLSSDKYGAYTNKLNFVCHSMAGLAARWYLADYSSNYVDNLILIGVPNKGSPLAKEANALSKIPKLGWLTLVPVNSAMSFVRDNIDLYANILLIDINGEAIDDMDISSEGSGFLDKLNNVSQPENVNFFGMIGINGSLANWFLFKNWYGGDSVVEKDSQLGTGYVSYKQSSQIYAIHWREPEIAAKELDNKILKFLDSTKPELKITSPDPSKPIQIYDPSINIKGEVYKEYLPADSILHLKVTKAPDNTVILDEDRINAIKPSDSWIPNNPDSPVAEFDELLVFNEGGTYDVSLTVKNPSGIVSDIKNIKIKVELIKPAITALSPLGAIDYARPTVQARIYSPTNKDINISSVSLALDGTTVPITIIPSTGGPDITVSYVSSRYLSNGKHRVTVNAQDVQGVRADKLEWFFYVTNFSITPYSWRFPVSWGEATSAYSGIDPSRPLGSYVNSDFSGLSEKSWSDFLAYQDPAPPTANFVQLFYDGNVHFSRCRALITYSERLDVSIQGNYLTSRGSFIVTPEDKRRFSKAEFKFENVLIYCQDTIGSQTEYPDTNIGITVLINDTVVGVKLFRNTTPVPILHASIPINYSLIPENKSFYISLKISDFKEHNLVNDIGFHPENSYFDARFNCWYWKYFRRYLIEALGQDASLLLYGD